jgi:WD40 repeat protein
MLRLLFERSTGETKMRNENRPSLRLAMAASLLTLASLATCAAAQTAGQTNQPAAQPILRIETGMHTAGIKRIGVDAANRYLVTESDDKTVRVWRLPTGRLLRVLHPPIGEGNEGRLYAVAISPDGRTVAVAGSTSGDGLNTNIYILDRESGRLVRRIAGVPSAIGHLVYSPDGRWLAATLLRKNEGVRVYETGGYLQVGGDRDYGGASYGADFDAAGRLVTSCDDGFIRLYDRTSSGALQLAAKRKAEGGEQPFAVSFSPDRESIAVGFTDATKVAVLSGRDLSLRYAPDTSGVNNGSLGHVAWSVDGRTLWAGGAYHGRNGETLIRQWADGGRGGYRDVLAARNTIQHILPLRDGGIVYGASDPAFGRVDAIGQRSLFIGPSIVDYRGLLQGFLLSTDGGIVQFGYEELGKSPARFSIPDRRLEEASVGSALKPPLTTGLAITDWKNNYAPKLDGQALKLNQRERSRSLAIAPDQSRFLLGTEFRLRLHDRSGKELWKMATPSVAWNVNISGDGKLAAATFGDGTIRWYRMIDGKELLAFFPHNDRKRWVVWTPSGYYDASPGAEDLIGWQVSNGPDAAADFFPVSQFRNTYYRPDVIARVLQTGDEARAFQPANEDAARKQQQAPIAAQLPPVVEIISPSDDSEVSTKEIVLRFRIRTPSAEPVTNVKALVDGRPTGARALSVVTGSEGTRELRVTVPEQDSTISVIAENRFTASAPATVRLKWGGRGSRTAGNTDASSIIIKPKLYVLAIGVSKYANEKFNLTFAEKDARDFVNVMLAQKGLLYREVVVYRDKALTNAEATKDEILDGLDWIRKQTTANDVAMVFFAGHGVNDQNNYYFFCPHNVDPERLLRTGVAFTDIKNTVSAIAGKALFFVDTCHSGNSIGMTGRRGGLDINIVINELSSAQNGVVVFSAATGSESSYEHEEWNNGAFTKALVEGLSGAAEIGGKGRITYTMLNVYVSDRVKELTKGQQHPTMISPETVPDFPIAVKR